MARTDRSRPGHADVRGSTRRPAAATPADRAEIVRGVRRRRRRPRERPGTAAPTTGTGAFANSSGHAVARRGGRVRRLGHRARPRSRTGPADGVARLMPLRLLDLDGVALGARAAAKARAWSRAGRAAARTLRGGARARRRARRHRPHRRARPSTARRSTSGISFAELGADQLDRSVTLYDDAPGLGPRLRPRGHAASPADAGRVGTDRGRSPTTVERPPSPARRRPGTPWSTASGWARWRATSASSRRSGDASAAEVGGPDGRLVRGRARGRRTSAASWSRTSGTPGCSTPRTLSLTGLTRNGVWLIEDGEVTAPVKNFRFTQSYAQALAPGQRARRGPHGDTDPGRHLRRDVAPLHLPRPAPRLVELHRRRVGVTAFGMHATRCSGR